MTENTLQVKFTPQLQRVAICVICEVRNISQHWSSLIETLSLFNHLFGIYNGLWFPCIKPQIFSASLDFYHLAKL